MEGLFAGSLLILLIWVVIGVAILIAPLLIWRNTNRTNRLLVLIALQSGVPPKHVEKVYKMDGSDMSFVFNGIKKNKDFSFK